MKHPLSGSAASLSLPRARGGEHRLRCGAALAGLSWQGLRHFHMQRNDLKTVLKIKKRELQSLYQQAFKAIFILEK